jgi:hypothetical protein
MTGNRGMRGAIEYDAFTRWRRVLHWQRGQLKKVKRSFSKRMGRQARMSLRPVSPE